VTARSAEFCTVVVALALVTEEPVRLVLVLRVAKSVSAVLLAVLDGTLTTMLKAAELPEAREVMLSVVLLPTWLKVKVGPLVCVCETKVTPLGRVSPRVTFARASGPLLVNCSV
jgi:hypothetical protein